MLAVNPVWFLLTLIPVGLSKTWSMGILVKPIYLGLVNQIKKQIIRDISWLKIIVCKIVLLSGAWFIIVKYKITKKTGLKK